MSDEYTPTMENIRDCYARYDNEATRTCEFDRWLAVHDQEVRQQIARDLMEKLPRILAETSVYEFGWLSDGLYEDAEVDSMESEVYVRDGGIDLNQIAEYAARIVGGK